MSNLRVTIIQSTLFWEKKTDNLSSFDRKLADLSATATDLIVLPEMFTTGFSMAPEGLAEPADGPTVDWLAAKAQQTGAVITGSFIAEENGNYYNRLVWMRPDGSFECYDKRHLFTLAREQDHYTAGQRRLITNLKGWTVLPLICYDLRFPVWSRNTEPYDLLIYVANWPERRRQAWQTLLAARAIENQSYTIGLNRVGTDGNDIYYSGDSAVIDYAGNTLVRCAHVEQTITTTLSKSKQDQFRSKLRFLPDRDSFVIMDDE